MAIFNAEGAGAALATVAALAGLTMVLLALGLLLVTVVPTALYGYRVASRPGSPRSRTQVSTSEVAADD